MHKIIHAKYFHPIEVPNAADQAKKATRKDDHFFRTLESGIDVGRGKFGKIINVGP